MKDSTRAFIFENKKFFECIKSIQYVFSLEHKHMYNYMLVCQIDKNEYSAMCEFAPTKEKSLLIWVEDFDFPLDEVDNVKIALESCLWKIEIIPLFRAGAR